MKTHYAHRFACSIIRRAGGLLFAITAFASNAAPPAKPPLLTINSVAANATLSEVTISGVGMLSATPTTQPTTVTLSGIGTIPLITTSNTQIVAALPIAAFGRSYTLSVAYGTQAGEFDSIDISLGVIGPPGPAGPQGATGQAGLTGPAGPTGAAGPAGSTGAIGPQGSQGPSGPAGPQGATGQTGLTGPAGQAGATGSAGPQGSQGLQGATGPQGIQGQTGDQGPAGTTGQGIVWTYEPIDPVGVDATHKDLSVFTVTGGADTFYMISFGAMAWRTGDCQFSLAIRIDGVWKAEVANSQISPRAAHMSGTTFTVGTGLPQTIQYSTSSDCPGYTIYPHMRVVAFKQ